MSTVFVLSGGASLGAVQVGMLRALFERGLRPDSIYGTSVGALNAAFIAADPTLETVGRLDGVWRGIRRTDIFPSRPLNGVLGLLGRRDHFVNPSGLRAVLERHLTYGRLEDAAIPLHVVATDVVTGAEVLLSTGPVIDAVQASASIPGVFPPVPFGVFSLIDGGVANNTPLSHPALGGAERVIVLPCGSPCALPGPPRTALGVVLQALAVLVQGRLWRDVVEYEQHCELLVVPPLCPLAIAPVDFSHTSELIERGYRNTMAWLSSGAPLKPDVVQPHSHA